jgi:CHAD domain-containing protein
VDYDDSVTITFGNSPNSATFSEASATFVASIALPRRLMRRSVGKISMATAMQVGNEGEGASVEVEPADVAERTVRSQIARLLEAAERVTVTDDPDAVHQLRTSARKLRASLKVFGAAFPKQLLGRARKAVKQIARALDEARVWDAHSELLTQIYASSGRQDEKAGIEHLMEQVDVQRARCREKLLSDLEDLDLSKLGTVLERLASKAKHGKKAKRRPKDARKFVTRLVEEGLVGLEGAGSAESVEDLQKARTPLRRLRHTLDVLELDSVRPVAAAEQALGDLIERTRTLALVEEARGKLNAGGRVVLGEGLSRVASRLADEQARLRGELGKSSKSIDRDQLSKQLGDIVGSGEVPPEASDEDDEDEA